MNTNAPTTAGLAPKGRAALGLVFIAVGVLVTLDRAGLFREGLTRWWALLLIGIGIVKFRQPPEEGQRALGMGLIVLGAFFQAQLLLAWDKAWPLVLVGFGAYLVWQSLERKSLQAKTPSDHNTISEVILMGGTKRGIHSPDFRGGYLTVLMGGIEIDLRSAQMPPGSAPAVLDVFVMWGGIDIKVPLEWRVDLEGVPFMGGFDIKAKTPPNADACPRLIVRGTVIMGGAVVQN